MDMGLAHGLWSLLILLIFIGIVAFVWRRDRRNHYDRASRIPFDRNDEARDRQTRNDRTDDGNV